MVGFAFVAICIISSAIYIITKPLSNPYIPPPSLLKCLTIGKFEINSVSVLIHLISIFVPISSIMNTPSLTTLVDISLTVTVSVVESKLCIFINGFFSSSDGDFSVLSYIVDS